MLPFLSFSPCSSPCAWAGRVVVGVPLAIMCLPGSGSLLLLLLLPASSCAAPENQPPATRQQTGHRAEEDAPVLLWGVCCMCSGVGVSEMCDRIEDEQA